MKNFLSIVAFLSISTTMSAQSRWSLGAEYAALRANVAVPHDPARASLSGLSSNGGGISLQWRAARRLMLETGVLFGAVGSTWVSPDANRTKFESRIPMLQVPLIAHLELFRVQRLAFDATFGIAATRAANGRLLNRTNDAQVGLFETNQMGTAAVAGAQITYVARLPLRLAIRYTQGVNSVLPAEDSKIRVVNALLGVRVLQW